MKEKDEAWLVKFFAVVVGAAVWYCWPLLIDQHSNGDPSVLGWVLFGVWLVPGTLLLGGLRELYRHLTKNN